LIKTFLSIVALLLPWWSDSRSTPAACLHAKLQRRVTMMPIFANARARFGLLIFAPVMLVLPGTVHAQSAPPGTVAPAFREQIPNIPGKSIVGVVVTYPPGGKTPSHRHARSAFITGYVLSRSIRSQIDDGPVQVLRAGESFFEKPGAHHRVSENASTTEPARLLAIFVVDTSETELTTIDKP
jgi:quercetin dioxygenase-like cupin family protein